MPARRVMRATRTEQEHASGGASSTQTLDSAIPDDACQIGACLQIGHASSSDLSRLRGSASRADVDFDLKTFISGTKNIDIISKRRKFIVNLFEPYLRFLGLCIRSRMIMQAPAQPANADTRQATTDRIPPHVFFLVSAVFPLSGSILRGSPIRDTGARWRGLAQDRQCRPCVRPLASTMAGVRSPASSGSMDRGRARHRSRGDEHAVLRGHRPSPARHRGRHRVSWPNRRGRLGREIEAQSRGPRAGRCRRLGADRCQVVRRAGRLRLCLRELRPVHGLYPARPPDFSRRRNGVGDRSSGLRNARCDDRCSFRSAFATPFPLSRPRCSCWRLSASAFHPR